MDRSQLAIVIPAFNEAATIEGVVRGVSQFGMVIVVDDASADGTASRAARAGALVVSQVVGQGYDGALDRGFLEAARLNCDYVLTMDADGQHRSEDLPKFLAAVAAGAEVVSGVRHRKQRLAEHLFALVARALVGLHDPLCGMKLYRTSIYRELGHFDSYRSIGTELLLFAACNHHVVREVAIFTPPRQGAARFGSGLKPNLRILMAMFRFLRRALFGFNRAGRRCGP